LELDPAELGFARASLADLVGGAAAENAQITRAILSGADRGPRRDIVLLNAAAALSLADGDWQAGLAAARASIDSGAARRTLDSWIELTHSF
jgi:anthranilate phosphoribosyltransferase